MSNSTQQSCSLAAALSPVAVGPRPGFVQTLSSWRVSCKGLGLLPEPLRSQFWLCREWSSPRETLPAGSGARGARAAEGELTKSIPRQEDGGRARAKLPWAGNKVWSPKAAGAVHHGGRGQRGPTHLGWVWTLGSARQRELKPVCGQRCADPFAWRRCSRLGCHHLAVPAFCHTLPWHPTPRHCWKPWHCLLYFQYRDAAIPAGWAAPSPSLVHACRATSCRPDPQTCLLPKTEQERGDFENCVCQSRAQEGGEAFLRSGTAPQGPQGEGAARRRRGDTGPPATPGAASQPEQLCQQILQYWAVVSPATRGQQAVIWRFSKES